MPIRIDLYTKAILTVIAGCLLTLCFRTLQQPPPVAAQGNALRVVIAGFDGTELQGGLPVQIRSASEDTIIPVTFTLGGRNGNRASIPVHIDNDQRSSIPVHVDNEFLATDVTRVSGRNIGKDGIPVIASTTRTQN
jgi:hypothetical protein